MTSVRRGSLRWIVLASLGLVVVALLGAWLTAPRLGGRMDPASTSPAGAHALVALLRDRGVEVVVAQTVDDVAAAARPDTLLLAAETYRTRGDDLLRRLAAVPGDLLIVEPTARARDVLAPGVRVSYDGRPSAEPDCDLREAVRAGIVRFETAARYERAGPDPLTRCYGGALVRYRADGRSVTVVGSADFMTNEALLTEGNAALAMNLAGERSRLIWYAPTRLQGDASAGATVSELVPDAVTWVVAQLCLVVVLAALWRGRRLGPLVAEKLPVVVRASETVEGRARLYRSRRARDRAAAALRTATLHRLQSRLGLAATVAPAAVLSATARRCSLGEGALQDVLYGPVPQTDAELFALAQALESVERQVTQS